jgi:amino acid permease
MSKLSVLGAFSVLCNNIMGPGVLGLPWAVAQGGLGMGMALLFLSAFSGYLGMMFLGSAGVHVMEQLHAGEKLTFATACRVAGARELRLAMELGMVLACSGALITSLIIIGDSLEPLGLASRETCIVSVFSLVAFPLSFFSQISFLRFSSFLSFVMMLYLAALMFASTVSGSCPDNTSSPMFRWDNSEKIFQTIPVFTFCFCGHMSIFPIVGELESATATRVNAVIVIATFAATLIFGTIASSVVFCFGSSTPQDLLSNYPSSNLSVLIARIGMAVVCCGFFPLLVQPVRSTCLGWVESAMTLGFERQISLMRTLYAEALMCEEAKVLGVSKSYLKPAKHTLDMYYQAITIIIGVVCLGASLATSSLGVVFSLSGATGCALLCNICPPWLYLSVTPKSESLLLRTAAWALLVFGVVLMPVCVTANVMAV